MNNIVISLIVSLIAGLSTMLGSILIFIPMKEKGINKFITFSLSFSLIIMIGISIFDLLPESILFLYFEFKWLIIPLLFIVFCGSYLLISFINKKIDVSDNLYKIGILSMIILIIHNLPEGVLTFLSSYKDIRLGIKLSIAIALHNIPEGIAIAVPIYYATNSKKTALKKAFISSLAEPIGALLTYLFLYKFINDLMINIILCVVGGIMIILAIEQLFPEAQKYNENKSLFLGFIIGVVIIVLSIFLNL